MGGLGFLGFGVQGLGGGFRVLRVWGSGFGGDLGFLGFGVEGLGGFGFLGFGVEGFGRLGRVWG